MVVERKLAEDGLDRRASSAARSSLSASGQWKEQYGGTINRPDEAHRRLSCDWSRDRFTLDEGLSRAVREVFVRLYEKGLIYRGEYMVNWCPRCHTALSDLEVVHDETQGNLWHIRYPVKDTRPHLVVATTRPETMLGDTRRRRQRRGRALLRPPRQDRRPAADEPRDSRSSSTISPIRSSAPAS